MADRYAVKDHFTGKDLLVEEIYTKLLAELRKFGPDQESAKKTSIHLDNRVGFAGVQTRKNYLLLNMRTEHPIESERVSKSEQVSKNRYHQTLRLEAEKDVDPELLTWLKATYRLSAL